MYMTQCVTFLNLLQLSRNFATGMRACFCLSVLLQGVQVTRTTALLQHIVHVHALVTWDDACVARRGGPGWASNPRPLGNSRAR